MTRREIIYCGRRKPVGASSKICALLERTLDDPGDALDFDGKVVQPECTIRAAHLKTGEWEREVTELHRAVERVVERLEMTPRALAQALGGDRFLPLTGAGVS